jgi:hypothetical protein
MADCAVTAYAAVTGSSQTYAREHLRRARNRDGSHNPARIATILSLEGWLYARTPSEDGRWLVLQPGHACARLSGRWVGLAPGPVTGAWRYPMMDCIQR